MAKKKLIKTGTPWEPRVGYSRATRVDDRVFVSGCAPADADGNTVSPGDAYAQSVRCIEVIRDALEAAGSSLGDVVRTRMYVTDISRWEEVGRAHGEAFGEIMPATTMVEVSGLIDPEMLVEIEAEAIIGAGAE